MRVFVLNFGLFIFLGFVFEEDEDGDGEDEDVMEKKKMQCFLGWGLSLCFLVFYYIFFPKNVSNYNRTETEV